MNSVDVSIDGSECTIQTISDTEIVCLTGEHKQSVDTFVTVDINGDGDAWKVCRPYLLVVLPFDLLFDLVLVISKDFRAPIPHYSNNQTCGIRDYSS